MKIIPLNRADDDLVEQLWGVWQRSIVASRVEPHRLRLDEFTHDLRYTYPTEHDAMAVATADSRVIGGARAWFADHDNLDKCWVDLHVDPQQRRRGVGSALVEWVERTAKDEGRSMVLGEIFVPAGVRSCEGPGRFAERHGYRTSSIDIVRRMRLPAAEEVLARHERESAAAMGDRYELSVHVGAVPEHLQQSLCDAANRLGVDAPTGDVDFEPESTSPKDYLDGHAHDARIGRQRLTALAVERATGVVAAYSDLALPAGDPDLVFQWGTLVLPEHRGHRLGMAVKAANLRQLARVDPRRTAVRTMNAEDNPWMVQINVELGFEVIEEALALTKDL